MTKRSVNHESDNLYSSWQEGMEPWPTSGAPRNRSRA